MSNSIKNVTVPLQSSLNMNRNKSLTCSSYDIFNGINAPVFGGSISPLHYKIDYQGDAKYSVDGERWTVEDNKLYRGGLLFKDFTGEYAFDMHDTGLDLDGVVVNDSGFTGIKLQNDGLHWYEYNSNFVQISSGILINSNSWVKFKGARIIRRDNLIFVASVTVQDTPNGILNVLTLSFRQSTSNWASGVTSTFNFEQPSSSSNLDALTVNTREETQEEASFFTVSKISTNNNQIGISVFTKRPKGESTFKGVSIASFVYTISLNSIARASLRSGRNVAPNIGIDGSALSERDNHTTFAYFVDNKRLIQSIGWVPDSKSWGWVQIQAEYDNLIFSDQIGGHRAYYATSESYKPVGILRTGTSNKFAEINFVGSSSLVANYNGYGRLVISGYGQVDTTNKISCPLVDVVFDSQLTNGIYNAGVTSNASLPTTEDGWKSWWDNRDVSNNTAWNPAGTRAQLSDTNFYTLFNGKEGNAAGISYAMSGKHIGTLLTEWGSIVQTFENCATVDKVVFKDAKTNTVKYIQRRSNITLDDIEIVGKYVLVRCTADENIYDISSGKWAKFSNDWNNRVFFGYVNPKGEENSNSFSHWSDYAVKNYSSSWATSGAVATGYDVAFQKEKGFAPSRLYNYTSLSGIVLGEVNAFGYELTSENGLDVFASSGTSAPAYKTTLFGNGAVSCVSNLAGGVYPITSSGSAYFNIPIIESTVVDSYNGKYGLKIDGSVYTIAYDGIRPIALYNTSSIVDQVDDFFIVQSQYYALINGYICSLSYSSSNVISGVEQIVNVQGMKFIGAFPSCAYFYSPSARAIFAFTGDADLQLFVQTDRITEVYNSKYYPNCEWIFMSTNDGLYVMTQNNTFKIDAMKVKRFFPTDDEYCVIVLDNETNDNIFISMNRYSGWNTMPVVLETSFFGEGDMKKSTITDWYIRIFKGDEDYNGTVKCSAKTITDIVSQVVKTFDGIKEEKLTKDKFDSNDNAMITFHTGCNALGTSCKVVSSYPICYFGFSIGSDGSTNKTKLNI